MNIGAVIKDIRVKKQITQGDLASQLDISQSYLSQIERNRQIPLLALLEKISKILGVPTYYIMFKGLEDKDIPINKRAIYKELAPALTGMIEGVFLPEKFS